MQTLSHQQFDAVVVGGGPAGLMAAEQMLALGLRVALFDAMPSVGRKFLLAGVGGMNITHSEGRDNFYSRYYEAREALTPILDSFDADALRQWVYQLGIETFVGSSGKVFPTAMKAAPLLRAWLHRLKASGLHLMPRHRWSGWDNDGALIFEVNGDTKRIDAKATVLALGGASWSRLGSNGAWVPWLRDRGVAVTPLAPANCGFYRNWSSRFLGAGLPVKAVAGWLDKGGQEGQIDPVRGELLLTSKGVEGSLIYRLSAELRKKLSADGQVTLFLDLALDKSEAELLAAFNKAPKGRTLTKILSGSFGFCEAKKQLLFECVDRALWSQPAILVKYIKSLPIKLDGTSPLDEAISTAGGVRFDAMNKALMLTAMPGVFCAGEMLDWEAPTGGYLLTACFATGRWAGFHAATYVKAL